MKPSIALLSILALVLSSLTACAPDSDGVDAQEKSKKTVKPAKGKAEVKDEEKAKELIPDIEWERVFKKLTFESPVAMVYPPEDTKRLFVVEKFGKIKVFERKDDVNEAKVFLDIKDLMIERRLISNEEGLLSLAFHPKYAKNGFFYIYYTESKIVGKARSRHPQIKRKSVIARFSVDKKDPNRAVIKSRKVILEIEQPFSNHNGSTMLFGKDGYLYVSVGDGGSGGDPKKAGQDLSKMLAKIIRIDIDKPADGKAYGIPKDNPFVKQKDALPEIWAYGLRNVWRMSFDRKNGDLWAGDVGQNKYEEISLITKGGNYGWRVFEGFHDFKEKEADKKETYIDPIVEHGRNEAKSITGGYVYHGKKHPTLEGVYIYGDYDTRRVWGLRYEKGKLKAHRELARLTINPSSFAEDQDGEIYAMNYSSRGKLWRVKAKAVNKKKD